MNISEARLIANRKNALRSTGPRTEEGKERSRRNGLKHGLTGEGVVIPEEDAGAVEGLAGELEAELRPTGPMGRLLVRRIALLSVRMDRGVRQESAAIAERVRHAEGRFEDARLAEVDKAADWIGAEPAANARRLRATPEGIDVIIRTLLILRGDLLDPRYENRWDWQHCAKVHNLMGLRREEIPVTRLKALSEAIAGNFGFLGTDDAAGLDDRARRAWARARVAEIIDAEVEALRGLMETLDVEAIVRDREEAGDRALFDPSKEAILARKYEAASERAMYRALRELREVEADAAARPSPKTGPAKVEEARAMGSSLPGAGAKVAKARRAAPPGSRPAGSVPRLPVGGRPGGIGATGSARPGPG